ncbi:hypothetical protein B0H11DRAFT_2288742 [Mycena galericulata]|nr:hypothetical protein B0H11DRAFT_2288742 [Mycena galericulata]
MSATDTEALVVQNAAYHVQLLSAIEALDYVPSAQENYIAGLKEERTQAAARAQGAQAVQADLLDKAQRHKLTKDDLVYIWWVAQTPTQPPPRPPPLPRPLLRDARMLAAFSATSANAGSAPAPPPCGPLSAATPPTEGDKFLLESALPPRRRGAPVRSARNRVPNLGGGASSGSGRPIPLSLSHTIACVCLRVPCTRGGPPEHSEAAEFTLLVGVRPPFPSTVSPPSSTRRPPTPPPTARSPTPGNTRSSVASAGSPPTRTLPSTRACAIFPCAVAGGLGVSTIENATWLVFGVRRCSRSPLSVFDVLLPSATHGVSVAHYHHLCTPIRTPVREFLGAAMSFPGAMSREPAGLGWSSPARTPPRCRSRPHQRLSPTHSRAFLARLDSPPSPRNRVPAPPGALRRAVVRERLNALGHAAHWFVAAVCGWCVRIPYTSTFSPVGRPAPRRLG